MQQIFLCFSFLIYKREGWLKSLLVHQKQWTYLALTLNVTCVTLYIRTYSILQHAQTHNFFLWLSFENDKLLSVRKFRVSSISRFHSGLLAFGRPVPQCSTNEILQKLCNCSHYGPDIIYPNFLKESLPSFLSLPGHMLKLYIILLFPVRIFTSIY